MIDNYKVTLTLSTSLNALHGLSGLTNAGLCNVAAAAPMMADSFSLGTPEPSRQLHTPHSLWRPPVFEVTTRIAEPVALDLDVLNAIEQTENFLETCENLGSNYQLGPFMMANFLNNIGNIFPTLLPETTEHRARLLTSFLNAFKGQSDSFGKLATFIAGDNWRLRPPRTRQGLSEVLDTALTELYLYEKFGVPFTPQPTFDFMPESPPAITLAKIDIPGSDYSLQLQPGENEAHGGFKMILSVGNQMILKFGLHLSSTHISIVQMQGGGKIFGKHCERIRQQLNTTHPFDWMLAGITHWAATSGFEALRGYGYRLNSSLVKHLNNGDFPPERTAHLRRIYDRRYLQFGMSPHPTHADIYELALTDRHRHTGTIDHRHYPFITELMNQVEIKH